MRQQKLQLKESKMKVENEQDQEIVFTHRAGEEAKIMINAKIDTVAYVIGRLIDFMAEKTGKSEEICMGAILHANKHSPQKSKEK